MKLVQGREVLGITPLQVLIDKECKDFLDAHPELSKTKLLRERIEQVSIEIGEPLPRLQRSEANRKATLGLLA